MISQQLPACLVLICAVGSLSGADSAAQGGPVLRGDAHQAGNVTTKPAGISEESASLLAQDFQKADFDGDGFITRAEMQRYLNETDIPAGDKDLAEIMQEMDVDRDGRISFDDYRRFRVDGPFNEADLDGDGFVSFAEFKRLLQGDDLESMAEQVDKVFQEVDTNGDGHISLAEWAKATQEMGDGLGALPAEPRSL